jgi:hypothetical protein
MREISKGTYEGLGGIHSVSPFTTTEKVWYMHADRLGIVLLDNIDNDWSFVALAHDPRCRIGMAYRCYDVGASFKTFDLAEAALADAIAVGPDADFYTEDF